MRAPSQPAVVALSERKPTNSSMMRWEAPHVPVVLRSRPRPQRRQFSAADAADLSRACGGSVSGPDRNRAWNPSSQLPRVPRPLEEARFGARQTRLCPRRHGRGDARQHAGDARMPLWRADVRRRAQHAQHSPRRGRRRLHARPRRGEGADRRPRILASDRRRL